MATGGFRQASVAFTAPADNGGAAITSYTVTSSPGGFTGTGASSPIVVTGLADNTAYTFTVTATNSAGTSAPSAASGSATTATVPGAPTIGAVTPSNAQASVAFTPPASNGGSAITGYTVTSSPGGFTGTGAASPVVVTGLTNGTAYTFTVTATNAVGTGAASAASASATPFTVPNAPTIGTATGGDTTASVAFTAPAFNGGSAITGYTATSSPGGLTATGAGSPLTVTGLTNGTAYTFTVTAANTAGNSAASAASNSVTPVAAASFTPLSLFAAAEQGVWYDPSDFSTMFQDSAGTIAVTAVEQPVGKLLDKSGRGNHATQATAAARPTLSARKNWLLATTTLATQSATLAAVAYTLSFKGTGTVTLSGGSTAGPLVGTGVSNRVSLTFTPTAGSTTFTVSGSVTDAQLESGSAVTAYQRVTTANDYDTVGFPHYLKTDGVDDEMGGLTAPLNTSSTAIAVVAGQHPQGTSTGLGTALNLWGTSGQNSHEPFADGNIYHDFASAGRGNLGAFGAGTSKYVFRLTQNGTALTAHRDGVQVGAAFTSAFASPSAPKLFGGGSYYEGNCYGIVVVGRTLTAGEIADLETYMQGKMT